MKICLLIAIILGLSSFSKAEERPLDFSGVVDKAPLQGSDEPIYYRLLAQAREKSPAVLAQDAADFRQKRTEQVESRQKFSQFVDLLKHPADYRGQAVTLHGRILRLVRYPALENDQGIEWLYEASLITEDAQGNSTTIVCLDKPANVPLGEQPIGNVTVSGYFLKIHRVPARDKNERLYPLVLAARFEVAPAPTIGQSWAKTFSQAIAVVGIATAVLFAYQILRPRQTSKSHTEETTNPFS